AYNEALLHRSTANERSRRVPPSQQRKSGKSAYITAWPKPGSTGGRLGRHPLLRPGVRVVKQDFDSDQPAGGRQFFCWPARRLLARDSTAPDNALNGVRAPEHNPQRLFSSS